MIPPNLAYEIALNARKACEEAKDHPLCKHLWEIAEMRKKREGTLEYLCTLSMASLCYRAAKKGDTDLITCLDKMFETLCNVEAKLEIHEDVRRRIEEICASERKAK